MKAPKMPLPDRSGRHGEHLDVLRDAQGSVLFARPWGSNVLVATCNKLLAALIKGDTLGHAVSFWAVGSGDPSWDGGNAPPDSVRVSYTQLQNEVGRKPVPAGSIAFLGGSFTNQLQIVMSFTSADLGGGAVSLREFGLFAGGTTTANSGTLINHRAHGRIDMQPGFTLERTLNLTF
jgi:hypothetical protein